MTTQTKKEMTMKDDLLVALSYIIIIVVALLNCPPDKKHGNPMEGKTFERTQMTHHSLDAAY